MCERITDDDGNELIVCHRDHLRRPRDRTDVLLRIVAELWAEARDRGRAPSERLIAYAALVDVRARLKPSARDALRRLGSDLAREFAGLGPIRAARGGVGVGRGHAPVFAARVRGPT